MVVYDLLFVFKLRWDDDSGACVEAFRRLTNSAFSNELFGKVVMELQMHQSMREFVIVVRSPHSHLHVVVLAQVLCPQDGTIHRHGKGGMRLRGIEEDVDLP